MGRKHDVKIVGTPNLVIDCRYMKVGDMMLIEEYQNQSKYIGMVLMRAYKQFVLLNKPLSTWVAEEANQGPDIRGRILEPGEVIEITIGEAE